MKGLPSENYRVTPFTAHKAQAYGYTFLGGGNPDQVSVSLAVNDPTTAFDSASDQVNPNGLFKRPLYKSIQNMFYNSASLWNGGLTRQIDWAPTGSELYVVSVAQQAYGEGIVPGSVRLSVGASTSSLFDDGLGRLIASNGNIIGHVFYGLGIAVVQQDRSPASGSFLSSTGMYLTTGSIINIAFRASHTIYQHTVVCTMDIGEFNYSSNPSMASTQSVNGDNVKVVDGFASGSLTPYITAVGLYSNRGELVAVAKFPHPIRRATESQQTFVIKFDV